MGKNVARTHLRGKKVSMVIHTCHQRFMVQADLGKKQDPVSKNNRNKKGLRFGLISTVLPSKHKVLCSNAKTAKKKKKKIEMYV
jgi:hypothetical protein